jgi:hypothetical protein
MRAVLEAAGLVRANRCEALVWTLDLYHRQGGQLSDLTRSARCSKQTRQTHSEVKRAAGAGRELVRNGHLRPARSTGCECCRAPEQYWNLQRCSLSGPHLLSLLPWTLSSFDASHGSRHRARAVLRAVVLWYAEIPSGSHLAEMMLALICSASLR